MNTFEDHTLWAEHTLRPNVDQHPRQNDWFLLHTRTEPLPCCFTVSDVIYFDDTQKLASYFKHVVLAWTFRILALDDMEEAAYICVDDLVKHFVSMTTAQEKLCRKMTAVLSAANKACAAQADDVIPLLQDCIDLFNAEFDDICGFNFGACLLCDGAELTAFVDADMGDYEIIREEIEDIVAQLR